MFFDLSKLQTFQRHLSSLQGKSIDDSKNKISAQYELSSLAESLKKKSSKVDIY